jgi:phosphoglucosamine mutase
LKGILLANDTRVSGPMLENALAAGICSMGVDVFFAGSIPTPGVAFATKNYGFDAGIMVSASHNPYQDNGIKIFSGSGRKLPDTQEDEIERLIQSGELDNNRPTGSEIGKTHQFDEAAELYKQFCHNTLPEGISLERMKIVLDCANGATSGIAPSVFSSLGVEVIAMHREPNGVNINDRCGSQHTADLSAKVREIGAEIGLAFDGDGDRLIAVDEKGTELTGDHILAICGSMYKELGLLKNNCIVSTVMSNFGFIKAMHDLDIEHAASAVGDRYVLELMDQKGAILGGEPSGHMIFLNCHTTGDGIVSGIQLASAMRRKKQKLSAMAEIMRMSPQKIINVDVKSKPPLEELSELQEAIRAAEHELSDKGRVLIRYSGTQSMCRVMVEGPTIEMTDRLAKALADKIKSLNI